MATTEADPVKPMADLAHVRRIEAVGFRSFPATTTHYDGTWAIRLTAGHPSKRLNSVTPLDPSDVTDLERRVELARRRFEAMGRPLVFRLTPLSPPVLREMLTGEDWSSFDETIVMAAPLDRAALSHAVDQVPLQDVGRWVDAWLALSGADPARKPGMVEVISADQGRIGPVPGRGAARISGFGRALRARRRSCRHFRNGHRARAPAPGPRRGLAWQRAEMGGERGALQRPGSRSCRTTSLPSRFTAGSASSNSTATTTAGRRNEDRAGGRGGAGRRGQPRADRAASARARRSPDCGNFPAARWRRARRPRTCLIRELDEELGITTWRSCLAPLSFASHTYEDFHLLMPLFICRKWEGIVQQREHAALKWVRARQLRDYPMPPADEPLIPALIDLL